MATWWVTVFDSGTQELLADLPTVGVETTEVRLVWGIPAPTILMELPITPGELDFINAHLTEPLSLRPGMVAFLGQVADFPGEVSAE